MYLCALNKNCIQPAGDQLVCKEKNMKNTKSKCGGSACHRYDQSLVNLLATNFYHFNSEIYAMRGILLKAGEINSYKMDSWIHPDDVIQINRSG